MVSYICKSTQPPMVVRKKEASLEYVHVGYTFLHVLPQLVRMLSRWLLTKFPHRSSVGSSLRVRCWLGRSHCTQILPLFRPNGPTEKRKEKNPAQIFFPSPEFAYVIQFFSLSLFHLRYVLSQSICIFHRYISVRSCEQVNKLFPVAFARIT